MKKAIRYIGMLFVTCIFIIILILFISYITRNRYPQNCYHDNKEQFEKIVDEFNLLYEPGLVSAKYENKTQEVILIYHFDSERYTKTVKNNQIITLISDLKESYQKESDFPVFSIISADYDKRGNAFIKIPVKADSIKSGDGYNTPDVYRYDLIFVDENYEENTIVEQYKLEPFSSNWYVYSHSTFSG